MSKPTWKHFSIDEVVARQRESGVPYHEFLRVPALSCGVYHLPAGAKDLQQPHDEDEVYHVLSGSGRVRIEGEDREVGPGSILYVRATSEHGFFEIDADMTLLVFFASGGPEVP